MKPVNPLYTIVLMVTALLLGACNDSSSRSGSSPTSHNPAPSEPQAIARSGVPAGAPPAAFGREPALAVNSLWPFAEGAPRTSGTGRYASGAYYWTDFLYDASGALGINPPLYRVGTPSGGSFHYPGDNMAGNGADIFRVGIGLDEGFTYWRVDWQTLLDPSVPIAAFALDFKDGGNTQWPGISGLSAPGVDAVIYLSSKGVLVDLKDGSGAQPYGSLQADLASRSFVAKLPKSLFSVDSNPEFTVYLAAGIHDGNGAFRDDNLGFRKLPSQPPVFNMAFRDYQDEPAANNFWFDQEQAIALNTGDVSAFSLALDWSRMGETEAEPLVKGYSNRWYVSSLAGADLGDGSRLGGIDRTETPNNQPQYYDAVQPYGIYIPTNYESDPANPALFTWLLHSLTQNHNQYSATVPNFLDATCERLRQSVCATTLGRGPAGFYNGSAEVDFWEVWRDVARHFTIDPQRAISTGYSMGAIGTINLMIKYPDVFAGGVVLAGSHADSPLLPCSPGTSGCSEPKGPELMQNLKWSGYYHAHGSFDELVPFPDARATVDAMKNYGYRYTFDHYFAEDHIIWTLKDAAYSAYEEAAKWIVGWQAEVPTRKQRPGNFIYRWEPSAINEAWGIGPRGAWWLSEIEAIAEAEFAQISLDSEGIAEQVVELVPSGPTPIPPSTVTLSPALRETQSWSSTGPESLGGAVRIRLENVGKLTLDLNEAGVADREDKHLLIDATHPASLTLLGLTEGTLVTLGEQSKSVSDGTVTLAVPEGEQQRVSFNGT